VRRRIVSNIVQVQALVTRLHGDYAMATAQSPLTDSANWNKTKEMLLGSITKQSIPDLSVDAMSSTIIQRVRSFKLLGVIIEDNLKWNNHVDFICKKEASRLYLLKVLKRSSVSATDMLHFYAPQLVPPGTAEARISYGNSVCLSVCHDPVVCQAQVR